MIPRDYVYIENVLTRNVIDVQGGVKAIGNNVWPYSLNYTDAQIFRLLANQIPDAFGSHARRIYAYPAYNNLVLAAKTSPMVIAWEHPGGSTGPGLVNPDDVLPADAGVLADPEREPSSKRTLRNFMFSLEEEDELDEPSPIIATHDLVTLGGAPKQVWNIVPVEGEADTFFIESAEFNDTMVIEPLDFSSGGTLVLSSFTGSDLQKWRIRRTAPPEPTNFTVPNFEWDRELDQTPIYKPWTWHYDYSVKGTASWTSPNPSVLARQTLIISTDSSWEGVEVDPNRTSVDFEVDSSESARNQEHSLSLRVASRWQSERWAWSDELHRTPDGDDSGPGPVTGQGVARIQVFNCHSNRVSVRLWTYDLTVNDGNWEDHGPLGDQWDGSGSYCPSGAPREIELEDGHVYRLVAIDCGNLPPNQTSGTCHRLTSANITGAANGATIDFTVN